MVDTGSSAERPHNLGLLRHGAAMSASKPRHESVTLSCGGQLAGWRGAITIVVVLAAGCSRESSRLSAGTTRPATTIAITQNTTRGVTTDTARLANPVGVWRGTSLCTQRPSSCHDEITVYRITRVNADSLSLDASKIVNGQEEDMGVLGCRIVSGGQFSCTIPHGVWYFTVRADSLIGELKLPDNSKFRDVRAARSR